MEFLPQPLSTTCTKQQHCPMACGRGRDFFLLGVLWRNACTEQALNLEMPVPAARPGRITDISSSHPASHSQLELDFCIGKESFLHLDPAQP